MGSVQAEPKAAKLSPRQAFPAEELAERASRAQKATGLNALLAEVTATAERYKGVNWGGMGHAALASEELGAFAKILETRPRGAWSDCSGGSNPLDAPANCANSLI